MRPAACPSIACVLLGISLVACSSDDKDPQTSVTPNQPAAMNGSSGAGGQASAPRVGAAGMANSPSAAPPSNEGEPGGIGLNSGAGGSGNPGGGAVAAADAGSAGGGVAVADASPGDTGEPAALGIFVATASDSGGDLGGLAGADATCQALAASVGAGGRTWRAYLSTSTGNARDRIGQGPWVNANGIVVATDLDDLHSLTAARGTPLVDLFVDQAGNRINGQWAGSPTPNQHDMLTGSAADGTALAATCNDWTSNTATPGPQVGHSDGLGPGMNGTGNFGSWNSSHAPQGCSQQQLIAVGGAGRFYCFAAD